MVLPRVLLLLTLGASLGLVPVALSGVAVGQEWLTVRTHVMVSLLVLAADLAGRTLAVVYFASVRSWARGQGDGAASEAGAQLRAVLPWLLAAGLALVLTIWVGGAVDARWLPPWTHLGLALLTLAAQAVSAWRLVILVGLSLDLQQRVADAG